ncbi:hypothetical protein BJ322DRAFT_1109240 [Thelephora terrestris]|uniref:Uncharacterized protein n=1 Tax=Thelephora terrestris TaxID=56493 RepID=A0A9P6L5P4_9AGAM|nr:hypothetical protein BJ322DRAFT_1109240 [Thelephora terrestris]
MARHQVSEGLVEKKRPRRKFSLMSLGSRTKGWDKNAPSSDCRYGVFGKRMQRSIMGFGSLATAIYLRELISEVTLNMSHGTPDPGKSEMRYFHERLGYHKGNKTTEYKTMARAVGALFKRFPDFKRDITQAKTDTQPLIVKIRKIMKGAHAARNADANSIRSDIFILSHDDAEKRGWSMPAAIEKTNRGIKSESTARFLLPFAERNKYLEDPAAYREKVERNQIKFSLSGTWSAILYDESMAEDDDELAGLFRSETLLRCGITIFCSPSAGRGWKYPEPGARSFAASQKESNAEINGIKEITPEAIAYISTLAVFAVHDSGYFRRDLGGIDLSELYHDVVAVLRMKTEWAAETLEFWNSNLQESSLVTEKMKSLSPRLTARTDFGNLKKNSEKGRDFQKLVLVCPVHEFCLRSARAIIKILVTFHLSHLRLARIMEAGLLPQYTHPTADIFDLLDQPTARKSQADSHLHQLAPQSLGNKQKRRTSVPDSDSDPNDADNTVTPPQRKRIRKRRSVTPEPAVGRTGGQAVDVLSLRPLGRTGGDESDHGNNHIDLSEWEDVCKDIKKLCKRATAADLKEISAELSKIASMSARQGTRYYNVNYDRINWWKMDIERNYKRVQLDKTLGSDALSAATSSKGPAPKKKAPAKTRKVIPKKPVPPPRVTRSMSAQVSRQLNPPDDQLEPLTDVDD